MTQTIVTYCIVAIAAAWLVWTLFIPASLRNRLRGGRTSPKAPDCSDGCAACSGCPTGDAPVKHHHARNPATISRR